VTHAYLSSTIVGLAHVSRVVTLPFFSSPLLFINGWVYGFNALSALNQGLPPFDLLCKIQK
jgi:hypothetical protein